MLDGELAAGIEGQPLLDGSLIVKIERAGKAAQVRIVAHGLFPPDAGLVVRLEYGLPLPLLIGG